MPILKTTDFGEGEFSIAQDSYTKLQSYIDKYEKYYLVRLLGAELYALFIADLTLVAPIVPQTAIYLSIFNSFEQDKSGCLNISEGIKQMLIQFVYYHWMLEHAYDKTKSGVVRGQSENSENLGYNGYNLLDGYNAGIKNFREIQRFIRENITDYGTYNGICLEYSCGI